MGHQYRQTPDISMTDDDSDDEGGNSGRNGNNMTNVSNDHAINRTSPTRGADATETMDYTQSPPLNEKYFTDDEDMEIDGKQEKQFYTSEQTSSHHHNDDNIGEHTDENKNIEKHNLQEHSQRCIEELIGQNEHTRKLKYSSDQDRSDQNILAQNIKQANSNETDILASMSELSSICGQLRHLGKDRPKRTKTRPPTRTMVRVDQLEKDHDVSDETDMSRHTKHVPSSNESMKTMLTGSSTNMADTQTRHIPSPEESKGTMHTGSSTSNMNNRHTMQSSVLEEFRRKVQTGSSNSNKITNRHTMYNSPLEDSTGIMNTGSSTNNMTDRQAKHVPPSNESMKTMHTGSSANNIVDRQTRHSPPPEESRKTMHTGSSTNNIVDRQTRHSPPPEESRKTMHTGSSTSNMNNRHTMQSSLLEEFRRKIDNRRSNSNNINNRHTMEESRGIMNTGSSTNNMTDRQAKHVPSSEESIRTINTGSTTNNMTERHAKHSPPLDESRKTMNSGYDTNNLSDRQTNHSSLLEESGRTMNTGSNTNNPTDKQNKHSPPLVEARRSIHTGSSNNNNRTDMHTMYVPSSEESTRTMNTGGTTNNTTDLQNRHSAPLEESRKTMYTGSISSNNITNRHTTHSSPLELDRKTMPPGSSTNNNMADRHSRQSPILEESSKADTSTNNNTIESSANPHTTLEESRRSMNTERSTNNNTTENSAKPHTPLEESRRSMNTERSTNNNTTNRFAKSTHSHRASGRDHSPGDDVNYNANSAGKKDVIRSPLSSFNTGFHSPRSPTNASSEEQPSLYPKLPLDDPTPMPEMKSITQQKLDGSNTDHINMQKSLDKPHDHLKTDNGINVREQTAVTGGSRTPQQKDENHNDVNDQHRLFESYTYQPSKSSEKVSDWRKDQWKTDYKSSEKPTSKLTKDFTSEDSQTSCDEEQSYYKKHISKHSEDNQNIKSEKKQSKCKDKNISLKSKPQFSSMDLISVLAKSSNFEESLSNLAENHDISPKALRKIVSDCPQTLSINQDIVELKPDATICSEHNSDRCSRRKLCPDLHICQKYLNGSCKSEMCQLGHRWDTGHNTAILGSLSISQMSSDLLTKLFCPPSSDNFLGVCKDYNNDKCIKKPCDSLHICFEVVRAVYCKLKACSLNHDIFYPSCVALLTAKGITTNESPRDIIELIKENMKNLTNASDDESDVGKTSDTRRNQSAIQKNSKIEYDRHDNEHKDRGVNYSAKDTNYNDSTDSDNIESNVIRNQSVIQKRPPIKKRDYSHDYKLKNKSIGNFELEDDRDDDGNDDNKSIYISNKPIVQRSTQICKNSYRDDSGDENRFEVYEDEDDDNDDRDSIKKYDQIKNVGYSHNIENEKKGGGYLAGGTDDISDNFQSEYARNQSAHLMSGQHTTSGHRHDSESTNKNVTFPVNNSSSPGNLSYENNEGNINNTSHSFRKEQQDYTPDSSYQEEFKPHKTTVWAKFPSGNVDIDEICYNSVEGFCPYEVAGCKRLHATKHFHWQIRKNMNWYNLTHQQAISLENAFCDPQNDDNFLEKLDSSAPEIIGSELLNVLGNDKWQANFIEMTASNVSKNGRPHRLRRLCSEYLNLKQVASNTFMWYFVDANNKCVPYGEVDTTGRAFLKTQVTSKEIDMQYCQYKQFATKNTMIFENSMFSYMIDFDKMTQTNMSTKVSRKVKRRPTLDKKITKKQGMVEKVSKSLYDLVTRPY